MLTVELSVAELAEHLWSRYSTIGRPRDLRPLTFSFPVSNKLFLYTTASGRFVVKAMSHSASLYGHADVVDRLEVVGRTLTDLRRAGLPVEEIVRGDEGRYVDQYDGYLVRLYLFNPGRPFSSKAQDSPCGARALRRLHMEGMSSLGASTRQDLLALRKAYPLHVTAAELPRIRLYVEGKANASPTCATILDHWPTIEWAVERALGADMLESDPLCVVHADFHPRNALFHDGHDEATMIDFDNMVIDHRLTCLGFTILRFAFYQCERTPEALREAIGLFAGGDHAGSDLLDRLVHAMLFIEIEKVLRILHRVRTTGQYAGFLNNICPVHLANINLLRMSFIRD